MSESVSATTREQGWRSLGPRASSETMTYQLQQLGRALSKYNCNRLSPAGEVEAGILSPVFGSPCHVASCALHGSGCARPGLNHQHPLKDLPNLPGFAGMCDLALLRSAHLAAIVILFPPMTKSNVSHMHAPTLG